MNNPKSLPLFLEEAFKNPLLGKVKNLLTETAPEKWRLGGEDLNPDMRFKRPRHTYEQILIRDISNGCLALHLSQPVTVNYLKGGYSLTPSGPTSYTVEVRDKIFDPEKVVDPRYADNQKGKRCDVVASGEVAKALYIQVREAVRTYRVEREKDFKQKSQNLLSHLLERVEQTPIEEWEKVRETQKDEENIRYLITFDDTKVEIEKKIQAWEEQYRIVLKENSLNYEHPYSSLARNCFKKLEELEQGAQLVMLNDVLKDLEFD